MPAIKEIHSVEAGGCGTLTAHPQGGPGLCRLHTETVSLHYCASIVKNQASRPRYAANITETHFNETNTHPNLLLIVLNFH